jgi:uncharacterized protein (DUF1015 family)
MLYNDPAGEIEGLLAPPSKAPDIEIEDENSVAHRVWRISDPSLIDLVRSKMRDKKLLIADGHHRYETALQYRNEQRDLGSARPPGAAPRERAPYQGQHEPLERALAPYELVMMTLVNMDSPGLVILPTHRVVHGLPSFSAATFREKASAYFSVEEVDPSLDATRATVILRESGRIGTSFLAVAAEQVFLLDRARLVSDEIYSGLSLRQQALDVVQLHKCLLENALGITEEAIREQVNVRYVRDISEAMAQVRGGAANVAFLMNPVRIAQMRDIALAGEVLPQKSTDFYPKLLSGLTIYALE